MRPQTACSTCRGRRRKCEISSPGVGCTQCIRRGLQCSLLIASPAASGDLSSLIASPQGSLRNGEPTVELPSQGLCEELADLYFRFIHDTFHSLFHRPTMMQNVSHGTVPPVILYAMISLSARFTDHPFFSGSEKRVRGRVYAQASAQLLDLRDISLQTVQACVLLGTFSIVEGEAAPEAVYYSVACRIAMLLDLANTPAATRLDQEVNRRVWWSLCMIDTWSSAGVRLPRSIPSRGDLPLPIDETVFLQLMPGDRRPSDIELPSDSSLLAQMIKLNSILEEVNAVNEMAANSQNYEVRLDEIVDNVSQKLDNWLRSIPDEMRDTPANLARYASQGLGSIFVAVYLGYYHYGQLLYYQFLHEDCFEWPHARSYANKCKAHAIGLCEILYRANSTPGCEVLYTMVGHVLVIASTVQLHILLFSADEVAICAARSRLERNFEILTKLQSYWPTIDVCFSRFREFHKACQKSTETSFRMDRWMLRFLSEFARPVGEEERDQIGEIGPWSMQTLGFSPSW